MERLSVPFFTYILFKSASLKLARLGAPTLARLRKGQ
jgi:hypothetical protein